MTVPDNATTGSPSSQNTPQIVVMLDKIYRPLPLVLKQALYEEPLGDLRSPIPKGGDLVGAKTQKAARNASMVAL